MDAATVAFVLAVVAVAALAQSVAGFGFALILMPLLVTVLDVRDALVVATLLGILNSGLIAWANSARIDTRTATPLFAGALAGMPLGLAVLLFAPADTVRLLVGSVTLLLTAALIRGLRFASRGLITELLVGAVSGTLNTSTGTNGPPVVLYLQGRDMAPAAFRGTLAAFFLACSIVTLAAFAASGVIDPAALALATAAAPASVAGSLAGNTVAPRVETNHFRALVYALLVASALAALGVAIAALA